LHSIIEKPIEARIAFFDTDGMQRSMRLKEIVDIRIYIEDLRLFNVEALNIIQNILQQKGNLLILSEGKYTSECNLLMSSLRNLKLNYFEILINIPFEGDILKKFTLILFELIQVHCIHRFIIRQTLKD
jgi:hypothetical protein